MPLPDSYQSLAAAEKQTLLWREIEATAYPENALPQYRTVRFYLHAITHGLLSVGYLKKTFLHASDQMIEGRTKIIHTYGTVACVELAPREGHPFTGIFRNGARGLARLSLAFPNNGCFCPGIGLKFLLDGRPSVNTVAMPSLLGQGTDENPFAKTYLNPAPTDTGSIATWLLKVAFTLTANSFHAEVMRWNHMPFDEWAGYTADGRAVAAPVVPWGLRLTPVPETQLAPAPGTDYRLKLAALPPGTVLFRLMMNAAKDGPDLHVADLRTTGRFLASTWGDASLCFQHPVGRVRA